MNRLLFTAGGGSGCELINRVSKETIFFADAKLESIDNSINDNQKVLIKFANEELFISDLLKKVYKHNIQLLFPCVDEELEKIAHVKDKINIQVILPDIDFISLFSDKVKSSKILYENEIGPKTIVYEQLNYDDRIDAVIKPRKGRGSRDVIFVNSKSQIDSYFNLFSYLEEDVLIQERIHGKEYTVTVVSDSDGVLKGIYPLYTPLKKGITIEAIGELQPIIIDLCKKVHSLFSGNYIYNVQLIYNLEEKKPYIIEINPRISTTFCMIYAYHKGLIDNVFNTKNIVPSDNWEGLRLSRRWHNQINLPC